MEGLWLVPTPIGNLGDITLRAIEVLGASDLILAEDTRTTAKLLKYYDIDTPMRSFHMHNEHKSVPRIVSELTAGGCIALVSDAGSPGVSDPGFLLVRACLAADIHVEALPGATALIPALTLSGLPSDRFVFEGFLPPKKGRQKRLSALAEETRTIVLYESPHRIVKTLGQLTEHLGEDRGATASRELTKKFEETVRGSLKTLIDHFTQTPPKGEFVIVVEGLS
ncbi:MAG: 16S rRNA (cytidine(1402)-2'-O)-methyltransferase [Flavobacteriaceae bacterium]|jgi:16S rRNA (cytidine1402-2'-O)-methyltransferase|nr:16S rRNA (cytidine(1402)-2'-O)-methyltransferase [Flavobacteriaceae bacterium]MDG2289541.1 16S rRNA (cytidine(1402)-2'-O)-methyltransferase [Flavobacteriaceae bacterium]